MVGRGFGKNGGEWTGKLKMTKNKFLAVGKAWMAIF